MKVPLSWLKEYLPTQLTSQEIADKLTLLGLEVEGIKDEILEISLTPNLAHCTSIRGIARELAAYTQQPLQKLLVSVSEKSETSIHAKTSIKVENPLACPRYACRLITDVRIKPSPSWLKDRLEACGIRSVNNVVDITNLVMLELGQPLHAFDFNRLQEHRLVVRNAKKGEKIMALDGKDYFPTEDTLLICDAIKPVALAGIIGASDSEVTEATTSILLESAYFDPSQIRRACKRMGIRTEASYRFERGVDPNGVIEALQKASAYICELAQGSLLQGIIDIKAKEFLPLSVSCRLSRINQILGTHLAMSEVETILRGLGLGIIQIKEDLITVQVPTYRQDIHQEIDLIEEVARFYGFGNIHKKEKTSFRTSDLEHSTEYLFSKKVRSCLIAEGLQELLTCDLISPQETALIATDNFPTRSWVRLLNPHSIEQSIMRPSMLPSMLSVVKYNADHGIFSLAGFEVGRVHFTSKDRYFEPPALALLLTGERMPYHWDKKEEKVDFFDLKGNLENLFDALKIPTFSFVKSAYSNFHPGRQAAIKIENVEIGIMGEIHPFTLKQAKLEHPVYFAELNLADLQTCVKTEIRMQPLSQFPSSSRDWTVTVEENLAIGRLFHWIEQERSPILESFSLLDVYRSDKLGSMRKNVTFRFVYRERSKTISLATVENEHLRITTKINEHLQRETS